MATSCHCNYLIADEMKPDPLRFFHIKEIRVHCIQCIGPEFLPIVSLCENRLGKALRAEPAIGFLRHLEYKFAHEHRLGDCQRFGKHH